MNAFTQNVKHLSSKIPVGFVSYFKVHHVPTLTMLGNCLANWKKACFCRFYHIFLGKVHGSLARAGKVKGQTPKVIIRKLF